LIKVELHSHTDEDPEDAIRHSVRDLVDRAVALGYGALAITLHDRYFANPEALAYARRSGLVLIPSVERTVEGRHVLLINFPEESEHVRGFDGVRALKARHPEGLVVAPHPCFPMGRSLGGDLLDRHADVWDAIEVNAYYTRAVDFNRGARRWAAERGMPLVGNCDVHRLEQLGTTYSLVDVDGTPTADAVCAGIRAGRVRVESRPLSHLQAAKFAACTLLTHAMRRAGPQGIGLEQH
jgi:predicted metal-dependent phosphoesterase TrpH